ncbi:hypothetical protein PO124_14415 [Bacillus licheniformis]|nr:hypothetical protein [Bacillus licheniformis]
MNITLCKGSFSTRRQIKFNILLFNKVYNMEKGGAPMKNRMFDGVSIMTAFGIHIQPAEAAVIKDEKR